MNFTVVIAQCMAKRGLCPSRFQDNNRSCFANRVMTNYEERNSGEATVSNSFACPTTKLAGAGAGRPVIVIEREQIEFLRKLHFS